MAGNIKAQDGIFAGETLFFGPVIGFGELGFLPWLLLNFGGPPEEQAALPYRFFLMFFLAA